MDEFVAAIAEHDLFDGDIRALAEGPFQFKSVGVGVKVEFFCFFLDGGDGFG